MLQNAPLLAIIAVDLEENKPSKVLQASLLFIHPGDLISPSSPDQVCVAPPLCCENALTRATSSSQSCSFGHFWWGASETTQVREKADYDRRLCELGSSSGITAMPEVLSWVLILESRYLF